MKKNDSHMRKHRHFIWKENKREGSQERHGDKFALTYDRIILKCWIIETETTREKIGDHQSTEQSENKYFLRLTVNQAAY